MLYAFHYYSPWVYTTLRVNRGRFSYPDRMPAGGSAQRVREDLDAVEAWALRHGIAPTRVIASEFGVDRRVAGAQRYLEDLVSQLEAHGWHWAFYAFRQDGSWGGLDYELGAPLGDAYWKSVERGADPESLKRRAPNPLWNVLARELQPH